MWGLAVQARLCALLDSCCTPTEALFVPSCEDTAQLRDTYRRADERAVELGRATWDPEAAQACVDALDTLTCDDLVKTDHRLDLVCPGALIYPDGSPRGPCATYPCEEGTHCSPRTTDFVCRMDRAEGRACQDDFDTCGDRQRCRQDVVENTFTCAPPLCDGDTRNDDRTVIVNGYRGSSGAGGVREAACRLPPDGYFECDCRIDGVASTCKSTVLYDPDLDYSVYDCC